MTATQAEREPLLRRAALVAVSVVWGSAALVGCGKITPPTEQTCFVGGAYGTTDSSATTRLRVSNESGMGLWIKVDPQGAAYKQSDLAVFAGECAEWAFAGAAANVTVDIAVQGCDLTTRVADTCDRPFSAPWGSVRTVSENRTVWYVVGADSFRH